ALGPFSVPGEAGFPALSPERPPAHRRTGQRRPGPAPEKRAARHRRAQRLLGVRGDHPIRPREAPAPGRRARALPTRPPVDLGRNHRPRTAPPPRPPGGLPRGAAGPFGRLDPLLELLDRLGAEPP